jgi:type I restriction enzyme M protein
MAVERSEHQALMGIPQIAEIADVGRSAVGNWRKRHQDFPAPKVQTPSGALFDLREIEDWLIKHGKIERRAPASARLWSAARAARDAWKPDEFLRFSVSFLVYLEACARAHGEGTSRNLPRPNIPADASWSQLQATSPEHFLSAFAQAARSIETANTDLAGVIDPRLPEHAGPGVSPLAYQIAVTLDQAVDEETTRYALFEGLEELELQDRFAGEFATPRDVANLVAGVVDACGGTILDPAVGEGRLLMETVLRAGQPRSQVHAVGVDKNFEAWRRSRARFYLHGREADIRNRDALRAHPDALPLADAIVLDPPYGLGDWGTVELYVDQRWQFGPAPPSSADFAWLQLAVAHLRSNGRAAVLMPASSLVRSDREGAIRRRMVEANVVEGIVLLPPRLRTDISIPLALWLLRSSSSPETDADVLLVDASTLGERGRSQYSLPEGSVQRLMKLVRRWRHEHEISPNDAPFAKAISRFEILAADASLLPARYASPPDIDIDSLRQEARAIRASLTESSAAASRASADLVEYLGRC